MKNNNLVTNVSNSLLSDGVAFYEVFEYHT